MLLYRGRCATLNRRRVCLFLEGCVLLYIDQCATLYMPVFLFIWVGALLNIFLQVVS